MCTEDKNSMRDEALKEKFIAAILLERDQIMGELQAVLDRHKDEEFNFFWQLYTIVP